MRRITGLVLIGLGVCLVVLALAFVVVRRAWWHQT